MVLNKNVPFYLQVARILRNEIITGKYPGGSPFPPEEELAARFEVSKDVVRVSLRMLAEEGLILRIRSKGTFVCDRPNSNSLRILLTVCQNPVAVEQLRHGVELGAGKGKYDLVLKRVHPLDLAAERHCLASLGQNAFAAMVVTPAVAPDDTDNRELYEKYLRQGIPVIAIDHEFTDIPGDAVFFDEYGSVRAMTDELLRTAPEKTAFFIRQTPHRIVRRRNQALAEVAAMLPPQKKCVFTTTTENFDNQTVIDDLFNQLKNSGFAPEVMFIDNNMVAFALFERMRETGILGGLKTIGTVGDSKYGDDDFNSKLLCHYRLYDDFVGPLEEILSMRLNNRIPAGMSMVRMIKFKRMSAEQITAYFNRALQPRYSGIA